MKDGQAGFVLVGLTIRQPELDRSLIQPASKTGPGLIHLGSERTFLIIIPYDQVGMKIDSVRA